MEWKLYPATEFETHKQAWDNLGAASGNIAILDSDFVAPLINHFALPEDKLALLGDPGQPQAMCILRRNNPGTWLTFQPSQAPLGCWLQQPGLNTQVLCEQLLKVLPGMGLAFSITQQDPLQLPRQPDTENLQSIDYIETASIDVRGNFEDYWSQRSKNTRQNQRRQKNRLERENVQTRLAVITEASEMRDCIEAYGNLESAGWKQDTNTAIHLDNTQGRFYLDVLQNFCRRNKGIVFQYWYNDHLAATDLCILDSRRLIFLKTTYDESISTSSPAMLMHTEAIEYIFDSGLAERIEFYGKVMEWHTKLTGEVRVIYHYNYYTTGARLAKKVMQFARPTKDS